MRLLKKIIAAAAAAVAFSAFFQAGFCADDYLEITGDVATLGHIVYGQGGGRDLKLDLYYPGKKGEGAFPGVVFIHGGGWRGGHRGHFARQAIYLAAHGYVCACIEYRLSGEAGFPAAIEDVKCAIRWMRARAEEFNVDPDRIAASGGSAGGHLALLAGTSGGVEELEGTGGRQEFSSSVQLVVAFNPASEFEDLPGNAVRAFLGGGREEVPEQYRKAAPATWLDRNDPPMLLLHGTNDKTVPYSQSVNFVAALRKLGIEAGLYKPGSTARKGPGTAGSTARRTSSRPPWR